MVGLSRLAEFWRLDVQSFLPAAKDWPLGASIALNGACLTVVANLSVAGGGQRLSFDVSPETLDRTQLGSLKVGDGVHLEPALALGDALGGHLVSGHVDGLGAVRSIKKTEEYLALEVGIVGDARSRIAPYLVEKGSVAVDGVSLTVNRVVDEAGPGGETRFSLLLIPHTLTLTRFGSLRVGDLVNLEADMLAKYVCRNLEFQKISAPRGASDVTR